jgi:hypothetical protein
LLQTILLGYWSHLLQGAAILWIVLLGASIWLYPRFRVAALPIIVLTVLLGMHALPGFSNPLIARDVVLSPGAAPYTLYFNFDKTIAGILLLAVAAIPLLRSGSDWREAIRRAAPIIALNVVVAMLLSIAFGYVRFQPKWTSFFWLWATVNLLLTCLSEEAFFRGFVQRELTNALSSKRWGVGVAIGVSAVLFGAAHFAGGWRYVLLASVAGAGYGIAYHRSRSIEIAMLAHFALNATHFLLFTYPSVR